MQSVTYQLTVADLVDARTYAYNTLPAVRVTRLIPFVLTIGCLLYGTFLALQRDWAGVIGLTGWLALGVALIIWMYMGNRLLLPGSVRRQLARSSALRDQFAASWDADRFVIEAAHGQSRWPWSDFYQWQESPGGMLLWQSDRNYNYLPKRVLNDDQVSDLRGLLTGAMGKPGPRGKRR